VKIIVYIIATVWYPAQQARAYGKRALESLKKFPFDKNLSKVVVLGAVSATEEGMRLISIAEIKEGKTKEAVLLASKRILFMAEGIEGLKYKIETCLSAAEAITTIDMQLPDDL
jgi:hypothetical protein